MQAHHNWASTRENLSSGVCEQQTSRPDCADASAQSDQRLCYILIGKCQILLHPVVLTITAVNLHVLQVGYECASSS